MPVWVDQSGRFVLRTGDSMSGNLTMLLDNKVYFRNSDTGIYSPTDGVLNVYSNTSNINISSNTIIDLYASTQINLNTPKILIETVGSTIYDSTQNNYIKFRTGDVSHVMEIVNDYGINITGSNITLQDIAGSIDLNADEINVSGPLNMKTSDITHFDNLSSYFGTGNDLRIYHNGTNSLLTNITGKLMFQSPSTFDFIAGTADTDITFNFTGTTNSGIFKWMEDESRFDFDDLVYVSSTSNIYQNHFGVETYAIVCDTGYTKRILNISASTTTSDAGSDAFIGLQFSLTNRNSSGSQTGQLSGFNGQCTNLAGGTGTCSSIYGGDVQAQQRSANSLTAMIGLRATARIYNTSGTTGTVSAAYGITNEVYSLINSSTITTAYANRALIYHSNTYTSTFGTSYCYFADVQAQDGTMTNAYGLYVEAFTKDTGTFTNARSVWLKGQTVGATSNYGLVLDGDCAGSSASTCGAALVIGEGQDASVFYDGTDMGINTSLVAASDLNITCGSNKTIELQNPVYDDLRITPGSFDRPGVHDPDIVAYDVNGGGVSTYLYEFAKDDIASFVVQLPHSYKTGEDIKVHIHWTPGSRGNEESGNTVGWKIDYSWANINSNFPTMATADLSDACDGTDHKHQMTPEVTIDGHTVAKGISSMLICNVKRTDTGTDDTWVSTTTGQLPMILEIDFHFPIDTIGSRDWGSK